jgi:hypothetical protein
MQFQYFVGVTSTEELKKKYKELSKKHHPDAGGSHEAFVALKAEYELIAESAFITYPIVNTPQNKPMFENMADIFGAAVRQAEFAYWSTPRPHYKQPFSKPTPEQEEAAKWNAKAQLDEIYMFLKALVDNCTQSSRSGKYLLMEVCKIDNLDLEHFKFIRWYLRKVSYDRIPVSEQWVKDSYLAYRHVHNIDWYGK